MTGADAHVKSLPDGFRYTKQGAIEYRLARKADEDEDRWEWLALISPEHWHPLLWRSAPCQSSAPR